jgi:hypothetical protein
MSKNSVRYGSTDLLQLTTKVWILVEEDLLGGNYLGLNATCEVVVTLAVNKLCGTYGISWIRSDRSHDRDDNMFFDRERAGVELHAKECHIGNVACPYFSNGEAQEAGV